jgi:tetratricopeptide (TPR) repeat protein
MHFWRIKNINLMKRIVFLSVLFFFSAYLLHAQRSKVISVFQLIETSKWDDAKKAIEEAILDEKTSQWSKTWYARGLLCQNSKKSDLYTDQLYVAYESYEKALELDKRGRLESQIGPMYVLLANEFQKTGEKHFNSKKYKDALKAFETALQIQRSSILTVQVDTNLVYNAALAAYESKDWAKATGYLGKLHSDNHSPNVTHLLFNAYIELGDTVSAERVLHDGIVRFNDNELLVLLLSDFLVQNSQADKAIGLLDTIMARNPDNYVFPYTKGLIHQKLMQYSKAIEAYEEAIKISLDELKIFTNIGTCYYNIGVEIEEGARSISNSKAFLEEKAKSAAAYESAIQWLEKAYDKDPDNQNVILKLYQLYGALHLTDKINNIKARML